MIVYALYRGDQFLGADYSHIGLEEQTGITRKTLKYYATPANWRKRAHVYNALRVYRYETEVDA